MAGPGLGIGQCGGALGVDRRECVDHRHAEGKGGASVAKKYGSSCPLGHGCGQGR